MQDPSDFAILGRFNQAEPSSLSCAEAAIRSLWLHQTVATALPIAAKNSLKSVSRKAVERKSRDSPSLACPGRNHLRFSLLTFPLKSPFSKGAPYMIRSMQEFASAFHAARCVSTPLVAIRTADPASTTHFIIETLKQGRELPPLLGWDVVRGLYAIGRDIGEELACWPGRTSGCSDHRAGRCPAFGAAAWRGQPPARIRKRSPLLRQ